MPSNPNIGILQHNNVYYAFASAEGAYEFASDPEAFCKGVADVAKKSPELIQLLELHKQFAAITPYTQVTVYRFWPDFCLDFFLNYSQIWCA